MKGRLIVGLLAAGLVTAMPSKAHAQEGFVVGYTDVGPVIGLGGLGGADLSFGGRFEKGFRPAGNGVLGLGVAVDRWAWDDNVFGFGLSYMPISVTVNYHFKLENTKLDPFIGAGLGYLRISADCTVGGVNFCAGVDDSGIYFVGHAGIRYFLQPKMAFYVDAGGGGGGALHAGLMFKIGQ